MNQYEEINSKIKKLRITRNLVGLCGGLSLVSTSIGVYHMIEKPNIGSGIDIGISLMIGTFLISSCYEKHCNLIELRKNREEILKYKTYQLKK